MSASGPDETDSQILRIANGLLDELKIHDFKPSSVLWAEYIIRKGVSQRYPGPHVIPIGWCEFTWDQILLPWGLKGKLEPEEWTSLIESSLIYAVKLRRKMVVGVVARIAIAVFVESLILAALFRLWPWQSSEALLAFISGTLVFVIGVPFVNGFLKSLRLEADRHAANHAGKEFFLHVLTKIDNLRLENAEFGGRMSPRPTLTERIHSLATSNVTA